MDVLEVSLEARTGESVTVGNISIDKLRDGNYDIWAYAVMLWMQDCSIWDQVDPAGPIKPKQEDPVWKKNEIRARRIMAGTVTNRYARHIRRAPTARDAWIAIRSEFRTSGSSGSSEKRQKKKEKCSYCDKEGHYTNECKKLKADKEKEKALDDALSNLVTCCITPECRERAKLSVICGDIFHNPVLLHFCGHVFCGLCIKQWLESSSRCPTCRQEVVKVADDFRAKTLVEIYYKMNPSKAPTAEKLKELDQLYQRGEKIGPQDMNSEENQQARTPQDFLEEPVITYGEEMTIDWGTDVDIAPFSFI